MASLNEYSEITAQVTKEGFGSYLAGILPSDIATACGAFSVSVQQVKNITRVPAQKLAQVILNLETMRGLSVNGSSVPADVTLVNNALPLIALGSGPQKTYTMSDMFGCMSGLPYTFNFKTIQETLNKVATPLLYTIYQELYLACTWENATGTVQVTTSSVENPPLSGTYDYYYLVTGVTLSDGGGGYTRNSSPSPAVTISGTSGATATATVDTNPVNTPSTFGRVTSLTLVSPGATVYYGSGASPVAPDPGLTLTIDPPPDNATGGWPGMNTVVQNYIDSANAEIVSIATNYPTEAQVLTNAWTALGRQLKIEQRSRKTALHPLPDKDPDFPINLYPTTHYSFIDQFSQFARNVKPHMYSQTIEAISNWTTIGGQSMVGLLRELRNQERLNEIGIPLDNNIEDVLDTTLNDEIDKSLIANSQVDVALFPEITDNQNQQASLYVGPTTIGAPDVIVTTDGSNLGPVPEPLGYYDPVTNEYVIADPADKINNTTVLESGAPMAPGSLAGSPYRNVIPPNLNAVYASKQLSPSTYNANEAVDEVEKCNCDCWENL